MKYIVFLCFSTALSSTMVASEIYPFEHQKDIFSKKPFHRIHHPLSSVVLVSPPIVKVAYSNPMIVGQQGTVTFTLTNDAGNPAQTGISYTYNLPAGLSFPNGATVTNACGGGTGTITGNTVTFSNGSMSAGTATCTLTAPIVAAAEGSINPTRGSFSGLANAAEDLNNGVGANPTNIVVNLPACAANAGVLSY